MPVTPALPPELEYIWTWFVALNRKRQYGMGANALTSAEILAWQARRRIRLDPWEEEVIDRLDALYVNNQAKDKKDT
ncbi:phage tail assembly chaperone [Massilia antarctica]|uniref:phage tail assembly chaperone n=1 Tax=Massilia antarctica TaxID=2765360 RepID=UPI00403CC5E0